jgi:restriction system protein
MTDGSRREVRKGPQFLRYLGPVLDALRNLGGSGRPAEVRQAVAVALNLSDDILGAQTKGGQDQFANQVNWARFYLAKDGYISDSERGLWTLTAKSADARIGWDQAVEVFRNVRSRIRVADQPDAGAAEAEGDAEDAVPEVLGDHRQQLRQVIMSLSAAGFERLCQRLLRETGFQRVNVTGRSGDGGIDGDGLVQVNPVVSFRVLFQCKRYTGSVSPSQVRDFRGAMQGRADKGLIITTGTFTRDASAEAMRDGVPPIELIDGERLLDLFEATKLGLRPRMAYDVDLTFFDEFR